MLLDFLPYEQSSGWKSSGLKNSRYIHFGISLVLVLTRMFGLEYITYNPAQNPDEPGTLREMVWFPAGVYLLSGAWRAIALKDNRAFGKYLCPVTVLLNLGTMVTSLRIKGDEHKCGRCNACVKAYLMDFDIPTYVHDGTRVTSTACIMCMQCIAACPKAALKSIVGLDVVRSEKWRCEK